MLKCFDTYRKLYLMFFFFSVKLFSLVFAEAVTISFHTDKKINELKIFLNYSDRKRKRGPVFQPSKSRRDESSRWHTVTGGGGAIREIKTPTWVSIICDLCVGLPHLPSSSGEHFEKVFRVVFCGVRVRSSYAKRLKVAGSGNVVRFWYRLLATGISSVLLNSGEIFTSQELEEEAEI